MKKKRLSVIFLLPIIAVGCILALLITGLPLQIPKLAAETFGPVSSEIDTINQVYFSTMVLLEAENLTTPAHTNGPTINFQVEFGETPINVTERLRAAGLIKNADAFRHYLIYSGVDTKIQAGEYSLNPMMTPVEIAAALQDPTPAEVEFSILPGWRAEEIAALLPSSGLNIGSEEFLSAVQIDNAEGYLFPGTYSFSREISSDLAIRTFVNALNQSLTPEITTGFSNQGLTTREAIILASIIEREAVVDDEKPLIASVFLNRFNIGMKLDADPTVQYALGYSEPQKTWWTNPLSRSDLGVDSPYNTYLYPGLPPGPICNPGLSTLKAVAFPADTPYYYFRAACDGSGRHIFAESYEEHVGNACP